VTFAVDDQHEKPRCENNGIDLYAAINRSNWTNRIGVTVTELKAAPTLCGAVWPTQDTRAEWR
jgi:hypothetical protein